MKAKKLIIFLVFLVFISATSGIWDGFSLSKLEGIFPTNTDLANNITSLNDSTLEWVYNGTFQLDIGSDCSSGDYVKGVDDDGTLDCDTPTGGGGIGDKWIDDGTWISPNSSFASWINATVFTVNLQINISEGGIKGASGIDINASDFYDDGVPLVTMQDVNDSLGNWSQYLTTYPNIDTDSTDDATIQQVNDSLGNHSQWLATYPNIDTDSTDDITIQDVNDSLGNWSQSQSSYYTTTQIQNYSIVRSHNTSWLDDWYSPFGIYTKTNFSADYVIKGYTLANFSENYAVNGFTNTNFTTQYGIMGNYKTSNFTTDFSSVFNDTDHRVGLLNVTVNLTLTNYSIWSNGSGICIMSC